MVVLATPERRDMSSMVSSPKPVSVSRSSVVVSTRSRDTTTRGSRAAAPLVPDPWRAVAALFFAMADPAFRYWPVVLRYSSVAHVCHSQKEATHEVRVYSHDHRRSPAGGPVLRAGHRGLGSMARAGLR